MKEILEYQFLKKLYALPFVEAVYLYGSRARLDNQERSDIDLAINCPTASDSDWFKVLDIIDEADTLLKIDCVRFDRLGPNDRLKENILRDKKILYLKGD